MKIDTKPFENFFKDMRNFIGASMLLIGFISICPTFKETVSNHSINIINFSLAMAFLYALIFWTLKKCKKGIRRKINFPETIIEVKYGDLFKENGHLVIGVNDCFDTELGEVISPDSIQGQFENIFYKDNIIQLDSGIVNQLGLKNLQPNIKHTKKMGKKEYYSLGTTVTLGDINKRYFLCAYSKMDDNCKAESNFTWINFSLLGLWEEIRIKGQRKEVVMPLIGSGLSRANEDRTMLLASILLSYLSESRRQTIASKLTIVLSEKDKKHYDLQQIENIINNLIKE